MTISLPSNATVITGASDGIGKEFASQLAKKKFNVLLVSRTESKLQALAQELGTVTRYCVANKVDNRSTNFFLQSKLMALKRRLLLWISLKAMPLTTLTLDNLSTASKSVCSVCQKLKSLKFAYQPPMTCSPFRYWLIVNNVGTNHDIPTPFAEESEETISNIVEVNINGALKTTKLVLPQMKAR